MNKSDHESLKPDLYVDLGQEQRFANEQKEEHKVDMEDAMVSNTFALPSNYLHERLEGSFLICLLEYLPGQPFGLKKALWCYGVLQYVVQSLG